MALQTLVVALVVAACFTYAAWVLMPSAARRRLATALLKLPLPAPLAAKMRVSAMASSGCGCDGCDAGSAAAKGKGKSAGAPVAQPITFQPRPRRQG